MQNTFNINAPAENSIQGWSYHDALTASTSLQDAAAAIAASGGIGLPQGPTESTSAEQFKNIQIVLGHVNRVQSLARDVMFGTENPYQPNMNVNQTAQDIAALKQAIQVLADIMRQTGIGALPILSPAAPGTPPPFNEDQLLEECTRGVQALYEKTKRSQDSAKIVSDLLGPPPGYGGDQSRR